MKKCYCCSGESFENCCQPFLKGEKYPDSAEKLMRSRYAAYATRELSYLEKTTDAQALGDMDMNANREWAEKAEFTGLEILSATEDKNKGLVEFKAQFKLVGSDEIHSHHEVSTFRKQAGVWFFRNGRVIQPKT